MRKKQHFILIACTSIALLLFFFWGRETQNFTSQMTPEDTAPLETTARTHKLRATDEHHDAGKWARRLAARRNANDLQSTIDTFKESGNCLYYFIARSALDKDHADDGSTPERKLLWQSVREKTESLCRDTDEETVARAFMVAVWEAAKQGDADAQSCFIISGDDFPTANHKLSGRYRKYLQARYIKYGPAIIQSALERGDPYVADKLIYRNFPINFIVDNPRVEEMIPPPDPYLTYRAAQLALYRTHPESPSHKSLENNLNRFVELEILPDDKIIRAEEWAKATYAREFANTSPIDPSKQTPCHSIDGEAP